MLSLAIDSSEDTKMFKKITHNYVSELDKFLAKLRKEIPETASQKKEREKFARLDNLRDHKQPKNENQIWEDF